MPTFMFTLLADISNVIEVPSKCCLSRVEDCICLEGVIIVGAMIIISEGYGDAFRNSHAVPWKIRYVCIRYRHIPELASVVTDTRGWAYYTVLIYWCEIS